MPKISVIIPCYNLGQYIQEALYSVAAQTFQDYEIIVINDGSTDKKTNQILGGLECSKLKLITTANQGLAKARNTGILQSTGQYILPLDADDKIAPTYLEKALDILEKSKNVGIVYCKAEFFGEENFEWDLPEYSLSRMLIDNLIFASAFFRRDDWEKIGGYRSEMIYGWEDYDFWLSIIELERKVYLIPERLFYYRKRRDSMVNQMTQENKFASYKKIVNNHKELYLDNINALFKYIYFLRDDIKKFQKSQILKDTKIHELNLEIIKGNKEISDLKNQFSDRRELMRQIFKIVRNKFRSDHKK